MNKAEFISALADAAGTSKADATAHVDATVSVITNTLKGESIQIKASNVPAFKAGKAFKDALN